MSFAGGPSLPRSEYRRRMASAATVIGARKRLVLNYHSSKTRIRCSRGHPGFAIAERKRYGSILKKGRLVDAYRFLHKEKIVASGGLEIPLETKWEIEVKFST